MMTQNLLIAEDHGELRHMLRIALGYGKYVMHEATDGESALVLARTAQPDVAVLDVMMPGKVNGLAVCRYLKSNQATNTCFVVLVTALGQSEDIEAGRAAGADAYFVKPFSPMRLIEVIEGRGSVPQKPVSMLYVGPRREN